MERKQDIRKELLRKRNSLTEEKRNIYSKLIAEHIFSLKQYNAADALLIYASYQSEVSTYGIMENAFKAGKKIYCPKVLAPGIMEFYEITSLKDIIPGFKNIPEPVSMDFPYRNPNCGETLMLMPLVGFDSQKNRLGYGGGFYDRYLEQFPYLERIALGYECQKTDFPIPTEGTDKKPDSIVTETNVY